MSSPLSGPNLPKDVRVFFSEQSVNEGQESAEHAAGLRYKADRVKAHIEAILRKNKSKTTFHGMEALAAAAEHCPAGRPALLRQGQVIFGTVSIAGHKHAKALKGWLYNTLAPFLTLTLEGQMRSFAYLHAAVYVGKHKDCHYVVHNSGAKADTGEGFITVNQLERAFETAASFFVVSPPKDQQGRSTRYLVQQRALASVGVSYEYHARAVNCETFVTALFGLLAEHFYEPLQTEVLASPEVKDVLEQRKRDIWRFQRFHRALCDQIESVPEGTVLTLKYLVERPDKAAVPWFQQMADAYIRYVEAAERLDFFMISSFGVS